MRQKQSEAIQFMESHPRDTLRIFLAAIRGQLDGHLGSDTGHLGHAAGGRAGDAGGEFYFLSLFGLLGLLFMYREKNQYAFPIAMFPLIYPSCITSRTVR